MQIDIYQRDLESARRAEKLDSPGVSSTQKYPYPQKVSTFFVSIGASGIGWFRLRNDESGAVPSGANGTTPIPFGNPLLRGERLFARNVCSAGSGPTQVSLCMFDGFTIAVENTQNFLLALTLKYLNCHLLRDAQKKLDIKRK